MAFPTTSLIDNFNRADQDPIASGWAGPLTTGDRQLRVSSNQCAPHSVDLYGDSYWNTSIGPDCEIYVSLASALASGAQVFLHFRAFPQAGASGGYAVKFFNSGGDDLVVIEKDGSQIGTTIDYEPNTFGSGDAFGASITGNSIRAYYKVTAGSWVDIGGTTDSTYTGAGYLGITIIGGSVRLDDFSGGTVGVAGGSSGPVRMLTLGVG